MKQLGEFVPIESSESELPILQPEHETAITSPVGVASLVFMLGIGQLMLIGSTAVSCWGGCNFSLPLFLLGVLAAAGLFATSVALKGLKAVGWFAVTSTIVLLIPGALISLVGGGMFVYGVVIVIGQTAMYVTR